ncbi:hypothetical protein C922_05391 [Plasmodium inui San Antonio 1]|uniref:Uncharacterized protein n=1 Tax=Plasmodium inui San Antonio 1 TaxID=1237626 RepID=W6ZY55_9APIC|nr:hypothetical protein C922_05391 [Plasmodium inui San Antonio 1]EUD64225.1 hypothetical protein C922_05391 [Plasmodium inui San Antonio 1]
MAQKRILAPTQLPNPKTDESPTTKSLSVKLSILPYTQDKLVLDNPQSQKSRIQNPSKEPGNSNLNDPQKERP